MDRFAELKAFCTVAACGGFSPAARRLGLVTSSVARLVDALESRLGAVLLNRSTRSVTLTDAGRTYYEEALRILERLDAADEAAADGAAGVLRVAAPVTFSTLYVAPILPALRARHPRLTLDLRLDDAPANLVDEAIDVAIRIGSLDPQSNLVARKLAAHDRVLCASPAYLAAHGAPETPIALAAHDCLQFAFGAGRRTWRLQADDSKADAEDVEVRGVVHANNSEVLRQAALGGLGIAMLARWLVQRDLRAGTLVQVLPGYRVNPGPMDVGLYALYPASRRNSTKIRAFVDLLAEHLAEQDLGDRLSGQPGAPPA
jgi:DNA-binding transcriptional LysR family regulator